MAFFCFLKKLRFKVQIPGRVKNIYKKSLITMTRYFYILNKIYNTNPEITCWCTFCSLDGILLGIAAHFACICRG